MIGEGRGWGLGNNVRTGGGDELVLLGVVMLLEILGCVQATWVSMCCW